MSILTQNQGDSFINVLHMISCQVRVWGVSIILKKTPENENETDIKGNCGDFMDETLL